MSQNLDWPGLLKWSIAYHDSVNGDSSDISEMKEEDRQFLLNAMDANVMDEIKRIKVLLHVLRLPSDAQKLYIMQCESQGSLEALHEKETLRSILEVREEDQRRKTAQLPTFSEEIPSSEIKVEASKEYPPASPELLKKLVAKVEDEKLDAIEELEERILKKDNSLGFAHYNGLGILFHAIRECTNLEILAGMWKLLAIAVKMNPSVQLLACKVHLVQLALSQLSIDGKVVQKERASSNNSTDKTTEGLQVSVISANRDHFTDKSFPSTSLGYSVVRNVLYFLCSVLEGCKPSQLLFLSNDGLLRVLNLLKVQGEDRNLQACKRRVFDILLFLLDHEDVVKVSPQVALALSGKNTYNTDASIHNNMKETREVSGNASDKADKTSSSNTLIESKEHHINEGWHLTQGIVNIEEETVGLHGLILEQLLATSFLADIANIPTTASDRLLRECMLAVLNQCNTLKPSSITATSNTELTKHLLTRRKAIEKELMQDDGTLHDEYNA